MVEYLSEIARLEEEIKKTQYNKATQHHIGLIKAKIAKLREKQEARSKSGGVKDGFQVRKTGDGTVILLGFPSTGKSTLLNAICGTKSAIAAYAFTTLTVVPGMLLYKHARIQILDVPGIVAGASVGKGRGKEVLACMRSADLCLLVADVLRPHEIDVLKNEAFAVGIRLNQRRPDVQITRSTKGGINVLTTVKLTQLTPETIKAVMQELRITNADVLIREDIDVDQLIDCVEDNKKYMPAVSVFNKVDLADARTLKAIERQHHPDIFVSAQHGKNVEALKEIIYERLDLIRIFLKEPGKPADMDVPMIMFRKSTVRALCEKLHKDFALKFRFARVWGQSAKFPGQKLMLGHTLRDRDIVEIHLK
jgi:small GTP-binding protein